MMPDLSDLEDNTFRYVFEPCKEGHPDDHWYRTPLCQRIVTTDWYPEPHECGDDRRVFEHNDIVNEEQMHRKHELVAAAKLTDENTRRINDCLVYIGPKYDGTPDEQCACQCHWGTYYVNVYEIDRASGGPEEGGWWYDCGAPVASVPFDTLREAEAERDKLEARFPNNHTVGSVIYNGGDYRVWIEHHYARSYPDEIPHYE